MPGITEIDKEFDEQLKMYWEDPIKRAYVKKCQEEALKSHRSIKLQKRVPFSLGGDPSRVFTLDFSITISPSGQAFAISGKTLIRGGFGEIRRSQDLDAPTRKSVVKVLRKFDDRKRTEEISKIEKDRSRLDRREARRMGMQPYHPTDVSTYKSPGQREIRKLRDAGLLIEGAVVDTTDKRYIHMIDTESFDLNEYLYERMERQNTQPFPISEKLKISQSICKAIIAMHNQDIIHRDLKPDNLMYNPLTNITTIVDFADSVRLSGEHAAKPYIAGLDLKKDSRSGTLSGIVPWQKESAFYSHKKRDPDKFLAPESKQMGMYSKSSDVYAFGIVLKGLFKGETNPDIQVLINELCHPDPIDRPTLRAALADLNKIQNKIAKAEREEVKSKADIEHPTSTPENTPSKPR